MLEIKEAIYLGKEPEDGYRGYFSSGNIFVVLSIDEGITKEKGEKLLHRLQTNLIRARDLSSFDTLISEVILKSHIPAHFSLAAGLWHENILYVKTVGKGQIYVRRGRNFDKLIGGDKSASGYIQQFDLFVFTTSKISALLGDVNDIKAFVDYKSAEQIVEELQAQVYDEEDKGAVMLFAEVVEGKDFSPPVMSASHEEIDIDDEDQEYEEEEGEEEEEEEDEEEALNFIPPAMSRSRRQTGLFARLNGLQSKLPVMNFPSLKGINRKMVTFVGVCIVFVVLVWSVVLGHKRREEAKLQEKIKTSRDLIAKKLTEAEDTATLNVDRSMALISEAKGEVSKLQQELGDQKKEELSRIEAMISESEDKVAKKEEKNAEEFYDLALEDKEAQGTKLFLDVDMTAILDNKNSKAYVLSLEKKSLTKKSSSELASASLITLYKETVYFFVPSKGVFQFTGDDKVKKVIDNDDEWGEITDIAMYNGNMYLMDTDQDEIYKYVPTNTGFGGKNSYFTSGQAMDLEGATSLTIDSSLYISLGAEIAKFTRGAREETTTAFPESGVSLNKVFTNAELERLYAWDKKKGSIYILSKKGVYEKQVKASILTKADDFFVLENAAYVLVGQKIYKIQL